ncbi:hypothetical protein ASC86_18710 [Rhizobium sp. Root1212]|nr:hypothetical protein ASC86_18710 [Rhizobium sp. Root1212]
MDGAHGIDLEDGFGSLGKDARFINPVGDDVARGDQNAVVVSKVVDHAMAIGHLQRGPHGDVPVLVRLVYEQGGGLMAGDRLRHEWSFPKK